MDNLLLIRFVYKELFWSVHIPQPFLNFYTGITRIPLFLFQRLVSSADTPTTVACPLRDVTEGRLCVAVSRPFMGTENSAASDRMMLLPSSYLTQIS